MVYNGILMKTIRIYVMVYIGLLLFFFFFCREYFHVVLGFLAINEIF